MRQPLVLTHAAAEQTSPAAIQVLLISNLLHDGASIDHLVTIPVRQSKQLTQRGARGGNVRYMALRISILTATSALSARPTSLASAPVWNPLSVSSSAFSRWITLPSASAPCGATWTRA